MAAPCQSACAPSHTLILPPRSLSRGRWWRVCGSQLQNPDAVKSLAEHPPNWRAGSYFERIGQFAEGGAALTHRASQLPVVPSRGTTMSPFHPPSSTGSVAARVAQSRRTRSGLATRKIFRKTRAVSRLLPYLWKAVVVSALGSPRWFPSERVLLSRTVLGSLQG